MTKALRWSLNRLVHIVLVLLGAATLAFLAMQLIPGDPARAILGAAPATPEVIAAIHTEMGLDQPPLTRYLHYLGHVAVGDFGHSYQLQKDVWAVVGPQILPTAQLALTAAALAIVIAVLVATAPSGRWPAVRMASQGLELLAASTPTFWLGIVLLTVFSFGLGWFPVTGGSTLSALVLPAITLAIPITGVLAQVLREACESALVQPFVLTARTRGLTEWAVRLKHVLRHSLIPLVTMSGWTLGSLLGGAVVVETQFARPGLGRVALAAVNGQDFPVVIAVVMLSALVFVVINTVVDLLYTVVDPRLRTR
jgi:peptide/nickel transport system permease protein